MPTYEFRCPEGHEFEKFYRSISAAPPEIHCPVCGKLAERILSAGGGLHFKGSGFYITDYAKKSTSEAGSKSSSEGSSSSSESKSSETKSSETKSSESKSDSKPSSGDSSSKKD